MNEYTIGWLTSGSGLGLLISSTLYWLGGRSGKWKRRWVGAFVLATTVCLASKAMGIWSWWLLMTFPCLVAGFSLGYGGDKLREKVIRRSIYCLGVVSAGLVFCLINPTNTNTWAVLIMHIGVASWSVYMGVRNPVYASAEEFFISMILSVGLIAQPFVCA